MLEVPPHRCLQRRVETLLSLPAEFAADSLVVNGIAPVVPGPVRNELHETRVRTFAARRPAIENRADRFDDLEIRKPGVAADVVDAARRTGFEHAAQRSAVVVDVHPFAYVGAGAVDGQRPARDGVCNHQRNQLFRNLPRPIVVARACYQHRQAVSAMPGAHEMVGRGFAGRVGRIRGAWCGFAEGRVVGPEIAVDLVGRHVQDAERPSRLSFKLAPQGTGRFEDVRRAIDVGLDERRGFGDRAVHMGFRREVQDGIRTILREQSPKRVPVSNVDAFEDVTRMVQCAFERLETPGIGQRVDVDYRRIGLADQLPDERRADEAGAARYQECVHSNIIPGLNPAMIRAIATRLPDRPDEPCR